MKKNLLLIELCNYTNYPPNGHLSFARHMIKAFGNEIALVGITTDDKTPVDCWTKNILMELNMIIFLLKEYILRQKVYNPRQNKVLFQCKKYKKEILACSCFNVIFQTPEVFFNFKDNKNLNICIVLHG